MNTTRPLWTMLLLAAAATATASAQDSSSSSSATTGATSAPAGAIQYRDRLQALPPGVAIEVKPSLFGATSSSGAVGVGGNASYREVVIPTRRVAQVTAPVRWNYDDEAASNIAVLSASRQGPVTFLGVSASQPSPELSAQLPVPQDTGLVVDAVTEGSPAQKAGVQQNDVLTKLDDQILIHPRQLFVLVANHKEGESVKISLLRKGQPQEVTALLGKRDEDITSSSGFSGPVGKMGDIDVLIDGQLQRPLRTFTRRLELSNEALKQQLGGISSGSVPGTQAFDPEVASSNEADDSDSDDVHEELRQLRQALEDLNRKLEEKK